MKKYLVGALVIAVLLGAYFAFMFGCVAKTESILTPGLMVDRLGLAGEVEEVKSNYKELMKKAKLAEQDLDRKDAMYAEMKSVAAEIASGGLAMAASGGATAGATVGLGIMGGLATAFGIALRKAKRSNSVGGVVVQAVDVLRQNPDTQKQFEEALKGALAKADMSEADYDKAIGQLKKTANATETPKA